MIPNKEIIEKDKFITSILFQCECGGHHYLEVSYDKDKRTNRIVNGIWFAFVSTPRSFWSLLKEWWKNDRGVWVRDIELSDDDVLALRDRLTEYLEFKKNEKRDN